MAQGKATARPVAESKKRLLELVRNGRTIKDSCQIIGRSVKAYEQWRATDPEFAKAVDRARSDRLDEYQADRDGLKDISFSEFSDKYLGAHVFPHGQNVVDLIEGKDPSWLHPAMTFEKGEPDLTIVNMPPEHPAVLDTPLFTTNRGWITVGEATVDDWVVDRKGMSVPIYDTWESDGPVPVFDVQFDSGDVVRTSAAHKWHVQPVFAGGKARATVLEVTTEFLMQHPGEYRVMLGEPFDGPEVDLPVDPYLFGYWLGDGSHANPVFAVGFEDCDAFEGQLEMLGLAWSRRLDSRGRSWSYYVKGIRGQLDATGVMGNIDRGIPEAYFRGSYKQRLALLQGLMDADGTITAKDSRGRFVQHKEDLSRDVYRLVASVGLKPHFKHYGEAYEVGFRTGNDPVFRLERKAARQKPLKGTTKAAARVVKHVTAAGEAPVRCLSVVSDTNEYAIGDGMIQTRNAKSTTVTMNYVAYRIAMDPNVRVMIVSKTQAMARKFLFGVKDRLTHDRYAKLQSTFGPPNGYASGSASWTQDLIYVSGSARDSGEKDPTVQSLGIRGHIYGARADLIILDDVVDGTNAHEYERQIDWIQSEVVSRLSPSGSLLVVGTRLAAKDLYLELRNPSRYPDEVSPWTYLAMPAVLEYADAVEDWVTLWPYSNQREIGAKGADAEPNEDGLFPKWTGPRLGKKRARMTPRTWSMVYMQSQVNEDAVFNPDAVAACVNGARMTGLMPARMNAVRQGRGMEGVVVVAGLDPATSGCTAAVCVALDPVNQKRHVLDVFNKAGTRPDEMRDLIKDWSDKYGIAEWRIEKNGFQGFLTHDTDVNNYLAARGTLLRPHFTGSNKHDADFGVASMGMLLNGWEDKNQLLEFPSTQFSEPMKALIEQLTTWSPSAPKSQKTDTVMALWFAELACRDRVIAQSQFVRSHVVNPFLTQYDRDQQYTVSLLDAEMNGHFRTIG